MSERQERYSVVTEKQKSFAEHFVANGMDAAKAVVDAGYSPKNKKTAKEMGYALTRNPVVVAEVKKIQEEMRNRCKVSAYEKLNALWKIAQMNMETVNIVQRVKNKDGEVEDKVVGKRMIDSKTAISAIAEMNKMDGDHASAKTESYVKHTHTLENTLAQLELTDEKVVN